MIYAKIRSYFRTLKVFPVSRVLLWKVGALSSLLLLLFSASTFAQTDPAGGILPFTAHVSGQYDVIDPASENIMLVIPVMSKGGKIPFSFKLVGNFHAYTDSAPSWVIPDPVYNWGGLHDLTSGGLRTNLTSTTTYSNCNGGTNNQRQDSNYNVTDPTGAIHPVVRTLITNSGPCQTTGGTGTTYDGSGYTVIVSATTPQTYTVYDRAGNNLSSGVVDPDNVAMSATTQVVGSGSTQARVTTYTDTLGQAALTSTVYTDRLSVGGSSAPDTYTYYDVNGNTQTVQVNYTAYPQRTNFGCSGIQDGYFGTMYFPTSVVLPDTETFNISYEPTPGYPGSITGRLAQITLPAGGYIAFTYAGSNGTNCPVPSWTLTRTVNGGNGHSSSWTYTNTLVDSYRNATVTATDPAGNTTTYHFHGEHETEDIVGDAKAGTLRTTITCYNGVNSSQSACIAPQNYTLTDLSAVPITQTDVYTALGSSSFSLVERLYDYNSSTAISYGNVTTIKRWDVGATFPPSGSPLSTTTLTYANIGGGTCGAISSYIFDHPCSATTTNSAGQMSQTKYTYNAGGHPTQTLSWVSGSTYLSSSATYNTNGTIATSTDANNATTNFYYKGNGGCNNLLPTSAVFPGGSLTTSQTWSCTGGVITSTTDENGQVTQYVYNDPFGRVTEIDYADGGSMKTTYNNTATPPNVVQSQAITSRVTKSTTTTLDGLGRPVQTALTSDPDGTTYSVTAYDLLGRVGTVYNPTRCNPPTTKCSSETTWGYTSYTYDALNRVTVVARPDNSQALTTYSGNCATATDEAGKAKKECFDGLGRMTGVWEDLSGLNYETDYAYDALGNLLSVTQKGGASSGSWRTRTFQYDGLSRLTQAVNPESGTVTYSYVKASGGVCSGDPGAMCQKIAPSPNQTGAATVTTTYTYEALSRLTGKSYQDSYTSNPSTASVTYGYDGATISGCGTTPPTLSDTYPAGRRTSMCDGSGATSWSNDEMGRVKQERRTIGTVKGDYETDSYNLDGSISSLAVLGYNISYIYKGAGRAIKVTNNADPFTYVASASYGPFGGVTTMTLGTNPITVSNSYNNRLQPGVLSASTATATIMSLSYDFHSAANADNGNVFQVVNNRDNNRTQNFLYDSLNRIQQAYTSGANWGETFGPAATNPGVPPSSPGIDTWGNLTNRSGVTGKTYYEPLSCAANTNNQLTGCSLGYDAAGNMTGNGTTTYTFDAENRLISTAGMSYIYDGDGKRVEKCTTGSVPGACAANATGTLYWNGAGNDPMVETDLGGNKLAAYIYFNGQRIARRDFGTSAVHYYFSNHLGTHTLITDANGAMPPQKESDFYPYGGEIPVSGSDSNHYKFTGKERDSESTLDYFPARHYASSLGKVHGARSGGSLKCKSRSTPELEPLQLRTQQPSVLCRSAGPLVCLGRRNT